MSHRRPVSPTQSTTSLSDEDDREEVEDVNKSAFFDPPTRLVPAEWTRGSLSPLYSESESSPMSAIPPEILIHILKHLHAPRDLYSVMRVAKQWCSCSVELLWHKPSFPRTSTLVKMMRVLSLDNQTFTYARFIRRLNFLYLGGDLTNSLFQRLNQCDRLERLTLVNCGSISDDALISVLPCCPNLVAIDLTGVFETTDEAIVGLAVAARRLQGINLGGCKRVTDIGVMALATNCPLLRRVKLSGVEEITNAPISALAKRCPQLLEIDLNGCRKLTDQAIRDIWVHSVHMRELRLSQCIELTDAAFPSVPKSEVNTPAAGPNPFPSSRHSFEELPPLVLNRSCDTLRMLDLTACSLITDDAVEGIISHALKIRNIVFSKCVQLTDRSVESICRLGRHIHYLHLGHAAHITDRSVTMLAQSCTRLRYVDFANCVLLTDMSVFVLATLPKLRRIGLVRVNNLTDPAIHALADHHTTLERIHLSYCDQISVRAVHYLLMRLKKLTHLSLTGIPSFRRQELQQFCRLPPPEFNPAQREAFCVFSANGVNKLRDFLEDHFVAEGLGPAVEDSEDEDDDEGYEADPEEPLAPATFQNTTTADYTTQDAFAPHNAVPWTNEDDQGGRGRFRYPGQPSYLDPARDRTSPARETATSHHLLPGRFPASSSLSTPPTPADVPPPRNGTQGGGRPGTSRLMYLHQQHHHQQSPTTPSPHEVSTPPSQSETATPDGAPRGGTAAAANGSGFFRDVLVAPQALGSPRGDRPVLTPDLNHAEIGHGRGGGGNGNGRRAGIGEREAGAVEAAQSLMAMQQQSLSSRRDWPTTTSTRQSHSEALRRPAAPLAEASSSRTAVASSSSSRRRAESPPSAENAGGRPTRNVKLSLRNTFNAAGSFFGRHGDGGGSGGGGGGGEGAER